MSAAELCSNSRPPTCCWEWQDLHVGGVACVTGVESSLTDDGSFSRAEGPGTGDTESI